MLFTFLVSAETPYGNLDPSAQVRRDGSRGGGSGDGLDGG